MIKNKVLKAQPNNEQSLIMMATNEDRIISYEEKSQMSSRVNTLKSLQFNHLDTAHFVQKEDEYNRRQLLSQILDSQFYKSSSPQNIETSPIEAIEEINNREQTMSLNGIGKHEDEEDQQLLDSLVKRFKNIEEQ